MISNRIKDRYKRIIPMPKKAVLNEELIELGSDWSVEADACLDKIALKWVDSFKLSAQKNGKTISLNVNTDLEDEEYKIEISTNKVLIQGGSKTAVEHAFKTMWQLSPEGKMPTGIIEDRPLLKMRGFHINFDSFRQMDIKEALYALKTAADMKLNTVLFEYGNRFPYREHEGIKVNTTLTRDNVRQLTDTARELGMTVIPLQQTIAHLEYLLQHDKYASLRENNTSISQICPLNTNAFETIKGMLDDMIEAHPGIKYIHIGGDEARSLGQCPKCREKVEKLGVSKLYIDYINSVSDWVCAKGLTPIVWDDMICAHPEAVEILDKRITILYWDYWTVRKQSPYFIARYDRKGQPVTTYDSGWDDKWNDELYDLERKIMSDFATGVPLEESLGKNFMELYGPYLGDGFPKRIKGFPYIEFYKDKGFKVIGGPTSLGNGDDYHSLPNYWRFIPNIRTVCERSIEAGAEGVITTAWYNYHPSMFHLGIGATAQFSWGLPTK
ncbi:MAG: DUF4838 domain-containing protein [Caldicoprobacterales bacterium]|jgi:hypothetical protein